MNRRLTWAVLIGAAGFLVQCKDAGTAVGPDDENELITTVRLDFTESGTNTITSFIYQDPDGDGGNPATKFDTISLATGKTYTLNMVVLDESKTPTDDITKEIEEKKDEHLFVFTPTPVQLLTYSYDDKDSRGFNVGLTGTAVAGAAGSGTLQVRLRHQPPVNNVPVKDGTPNPGSDDANITFQLVIK